MEAVASANITVSEPIFTKFVVGKDRPWVPLKYDGQEAKKSESCRDRSAVTVTKIGPLMDFAQLTVATPVWDMLTTELHRPDPHRRTCLALPMAPHL